MENRVAHLDYWPSPLCADGRRTILAAEGSRLSDVIAEVTPPGEDTLVLLNGAAVDPLTWDEVFLEIGDIVQARTVLHLGDGSNPIAAVLSIAVLLAAPALAVLLPGAATTLGAGFGGLGGLATGLTTFGHFAAAAIGVVGLVAVNNLFPPRLPGTSGQAREVDTLYTLTGGRNQQRPFGRMLLLIGQHRMFPDYAAAPYAEFVSPNQVPNNYPPDIGFDFGFGLGIGPGQLQYSNVHVSNEGDQYLNELFDFGLGRLRIEGERRSDTLLTEYDDVATQVQQDTVTLFAGNVDTLEGGELDRDATFRITRTTKGLTTKVAVDLASIHLTVNDDGDFVGQSNQFTIQYRVHGTAAWTTVTRTIQSPSGPKASRGVRRSFEFGSLAADSYDVRVTLNTAWPQGGDERRKGEAVLFAVRAFQDNEANFNGRNSYAIRTRASKQISGSPPPFNADVSQLVEVWDGSQWVADQATSNPAWHYRQFARGYYDTDGNLMAGGGLAPTQINDDEIKAWGAFCDANGLTCNIVISDDRGAREILDLIAQCGWASYSKASGKVGVIWENADQPVSAIFTPANIVAGSFRAQYNNQNLAEEVIGDYIDKDSGYERNSLRRVVTGVTSPKRSVTVPMEGITDGEQVAKELNRTVSAQTRHRRLISWEVSAAGLLVTRGNVVGLAHGLVGGTLGGRLRSIDAARTGVRLSSEIAGEGFVWVWMQDARVHQTTYTAASYPSAEITLADALPAMPAGIRDEPSSYAFMTFRQGAPTTEVRITAIEAAPGGKFRISVRDEVQAYYDDRVTDLTHEIIAQPRVATITDLIVTDEIQEGNIVLKITPVGGGAFNGAVITAEGDEVGVTRGPGETLTVLSPAGTGEDVAVTATPGNEFATFGVTVSVTHTIGSIFADPADSAGGASYESVYAVTAVPSLPVIQRPLDSWGYSSPGEANGLTWTSDAQDVIEATPYLWRAQRAIVGTPEVGAAIDDSFGPPRVVGRYGLDGPAGLDAIDGADGTDGHPGADGRAKESIFARTSTPNSPSSPSNSWSFDNPSSPWSDAAPNLSSSNPYLWRNQRTIEGAGTVIGNWEGSRIVGRYGPDGAVGPAGLDAIDGADGTDGHPGADGRAKESIFARTSTPNSPSSPSNSWSFDNPSSPWSDAAPNLSSSNPYLWRNQRTIEGAGTVIGNWEGSRIVGRYGPDGAVGPAGLDAIDGADGTDGHPGADGRAKESIFARTSTPNSPSSPSNSWSFDNPSSPWSDAAPNLSSSNPYLWRNQRTIEGAGTVIGNWEGSRIVGRYGPDGAVGPAGLDAIDGADGTDGHPGADGRAKESIFARTSTPNSPSSPSNSWSFDNPSSPWSDAAPNLSSSNPYLWRNQRTIEGAGTVIGNWEGSRIVGRYGPDGAVGPAGLDAIDGADGTDGHPGADGRAKESIFARTSGSIPSSPSNSWSFDNPSSPWFDGAPNLTASLPVLWRNQRTIEGDGTVIGNWEGSSVVGRYGDDGLDGIDGQDTPINYLQGPSRGEELWIRVGNSWSPGHTFLLITWSFRRITNPEAGEFITLAQGQVRGTRASDGNITLSIVRQDTNVDIDLSGSGNYRYATVSHTLTGLQASFTWRSIIIS